MGKRLRALTAAAVLMCAAALVVAGCSSANKELKFGTGGIGGNYYTYGSAIAETVSADNESLQFDVRTTAGSAANLRFIAEDYLQLGLTQADTLADAANGEGLFEDNALTGYSAIAGLYREEIHVVVRADGGIEGVRDLAGKRVSVGEEESGVRVDAQRVLDAYGLSEDDITPSFLSFADSAEALENGEIDALFITAGVPTPAITELASSCDVKFLSLSETAVDRISSMYGGYFACIIPAGTYAGQDEDIQTVGVKCVLVVRNDVSEETVKSIVSSMFDHADRFQYVAGGDTALDVEFATSDIPIGFHKGAAAYYAKQGIDVAIDDGKPKPVGQVASEDA